MRPEAITFVPRNRLAPILSTPDGKSFIELVAEADRAVARIAPALTESLDSDVRALARLCHQDKADILGQGRDMGRLALRIVERARLAGRPDLADAAAGVWEMVDALTDRGVWHADALRVHADALGVLSAHGSEGSAIPQELLRLRDAIGAGPRS
ncbi:hypothetical protein [Brevundimonas sp.]|uniref:hypothetical protein n=1 Tax=Brevundimonas sp. TaxID=1871086 RepID=UPI003D11C48A